MFCQLLKIVYSRLYSPIADKATPYLKSRKIFFPSNQLLHVPIEPSYVHTR